MVKRLGTRLSAIVGSIPTVPIIFQAFAKLNLLLEFLCKVHISTQGTFAQNFLNL